MAETLNVAVAPAGSVWLNGCVTITGALGVPAFTVKVALALVGFDPFTWWVDPQRNAALRARRGR